MFSLSAYASNLPDDIIILNENQKNILKSFGCFEEELDKLTRTQIAKILSTGKITNPEYIEIILPSEFINQRDEVTDKLLQERGFTEDFIRFIINHGYLYKEIPDINDNILKMMIDEYKKASPEKSTKLTIKNIYVSPISEEATWDEFEKWPDPPSYPNTYSIGVDGYYHPWVSIRTSALYYSNQCLSGALDVFNETSSTYLNYDYYIFGEDNGPTTCHEGVDLRYTNPNNDNHNVYSITPGIYMGTNVEWGAVCIYDSNLGATSVYEHLEYIQYANLGTAEITTVTKETYIGKQGNQGLPESYANHLHFEVHPNENYGSTRSYTYVAKNGNLTLVSAFPYAYLNWY